MKVLVFAALAAVLGLTGCSSSSTTTEASPPPSQTSQAAPAPPAGEGACALLSAEEINQVLGTTFEAGEPKTDDARQISTCTFTMTDSSSGVELPVSIVEVAVADTDGQEAYQTNVDLAPAYFGNEAETTQVEGATKAYLVNNEATQSPVIGMLVGETFAQIQIGVEGATPEQAQELAATAATRVGAS